MSFEDGISTVFLPHTVFTLESCPDKVELVDCRFHEGWILCQDASLEVSGAGALHANAGAGKVGGADVGSLQVEDDDLKVNTGA